MIVDFNFNTWTNRKNAWIVGSAIVLLCVTAIVIFRRRERIQLMEFVKNQLGLLKAPTDSLVSIHPPPQFPRHVYFCMRFGLGNRLFHMAIGQYYRRMFGSEVTFVYDNSGFEGSEWGGHHPGHPKFTDILLPLQFAEVFPELKFLELRNPLAAFRDHFPNCNIVRHTTIHPEGMRHDIAGINKKSLMPLTPPTATLVFDDFFFCSNWMDLSVDTNFVWMPNVTSYLEKHYGAWRSHAIHLRLGHANGDFFFPPRPQRKHIEMFLKETDAHRIYVCTDNRPEAEELLNGFANDTTEFIFVDDVNYMELLVLATATNVLLSTSTFSWWAGVMNNCDDENRKKVFYVCRPTRMSGMAEYLFDQMKEWTRWDE
jgi:hypothetical protein